MRQFKSVQVYDRVLIDDRQWSVLGVYIGATGRESLVELACVDSQEQKGIGLMVPLDLIPAEAIFRAVDHESAKHAGG